MESFHELITTIKGFLDFFKDKQEKNFIYLIIDFFISEYKEAYSFFCYKKDLKENNKEGHKENEMIKSQINQMSEIKIWEENSNINSRMNNLNKIFVLKKYFLDNDELLNKYSIQNGENSKKKNKEANMSPDEIEANRSWRNNIFSLGLFLGTTGILYLFSLKK